MLGRLVGELTWTYGRPLLDESVETSQKEAKEKVVGEEGRDGLGWASLKEVFVCLKMNWWR